MSSPGEPPEGQEIPPWGAQRYSPSSYTYKPPWAQPHYPLIPTQRTGPPAQLGAAATPAGQRRPARSVRVRWALVAALCTGLIGVAALVWADRPAGSPALSSNAHGARSVPVPSAPPGQSLQSTRQALSGWYTRGAEQLLAAVRRDLDAASGAAATADWSAMRAACQSLRNDVESVQAYGPSPDPEHGTHLAAALADFARAATDCVSGTTTGSSELLSRAGAEITEAAGELERASARVRKINGN